MEMKNMIVLRNLPSNIVEEAWVILKPEIKNKEKEVMRKLKSNDIKSVLYTCNNLYIKFYILNIKTSTNEYIVQIYY